MIVRVLHEGQYQLDGAAVERLKAADRELVEQLGRITPEEFRAAFGRMIDQVRREGRRLPDDQIVESDLILPAADTELAEARQLFETPGT